MFNRNYRNCGCMNDDEENDYDYGTMTTNLANGSCNCDCNKDSIYDNSCGCGNSMDSDYMSEECNCGYNEPYSAFPTDPTIAESYVPTQYLDRAFKSCIGLKKGTIFPELVNNYEPCQSMKEIEYLKSTNKIGEGCNG